MNKLVEEEFGNCIACQSLTPFKPHQPVVSPKMQGHLWRLLTWTIEDHYKMESILYC